MAFLKFLTFCSLLLLVTLTVQGQPLMVQTSGSLIKEIPLYYGKTGQQIDSLVTNTFPNFKRAMDYPTNSGSTTVYATQEGHIKSFMFKGGKMEVLGTATQELDKTSTLKEIEAFTNKMATAFDLERKDMPNPSTQYFDLIPKPNSKSSKYLEKIHVIVGSDEWGDTTVMVYYRN